MVGIDNPGSHWTKEMAERRRLNPGAQQKQVERDLFDMKMLKRKQEAKKLQSNYIMEQMVKENAKATKSRAKPEVDKTSQVRDLPSTMSSN